MTLLKKLNFNIEKIISKEDLTELKGGNPPGGGCCAEYMTDPDEFVGCFETAVWGECPPDGGGFYYYNVSCAACQ